MRILLVFSVAVLLFLTILSTNVKANSSIFLPKAQLYYDSLCKAKNLAYTFAIHCFLFDKATETSSDLNMSYLRIYALESSASSQLKVIKSLENRVTSLELQNDLLVKRIEKLEQSISANTVTSGQFILEKPIDTTGHKRITVSITGQQNAAGIFYSDDQINWQLQGKFGEDFGTKDKYIYEIRARYYKVFSWASPSTYNYSLDNNSINSPHASISYQPLNPIVNQPITFTNASTGATSIKWEFGSPYTFYESKQNFQFIPTSTAGFIVHLYVQNNEGIVDTISVNISPSN